MHGYNNYVMEGYRAQAWGTARYKFMHKLLAIKGKLKTWNWSRAKENSINRLQEEYNEAFQQSDQKPKDDFLFDTMYIKSMELNDQF